MHSPDLKRWQHAHHFGQDRERQGERRTRAVIGITSAMAVAEIAAGALFGSMALLADGLHMASHAAALAVSATAYFWARRHAHDSRYSFGTGKVNALGGFAGAMLLAVFALIMAGESVSRLVKPVPIAFDHAILVACLGLGVNAVSAWILSRRGHEHAHPPDPHDHNLRAAYFHVLADALTSILAVLALLAAKYLDLVFMDPVMGIVGAALVSRWSVGLVRDTSAVLLDEQGPESVRMGIRASLERERDCSVTDLHVWSVGPGIYAAIVSLVAHEPRTPQRYKERIPDELGLVHVTVEVHRCCEEDAQPDAFR